MFEIFGETYRLDLDAIDINCKTTDLFKSDDTDEDPEGDDNFNNVSLFKYETIRTCIERVLNEYEPLNESIPFREGDMSPSFKLAFNTLLSYNIIINVNEYE